MVFGLSLVREEFRKRFGVFGLRCLGGGVGVIVVCVWCKDIVFVLWYV